MTEPPRPCFELRTGFCAAFANGRDRCEPGTCRMLAAPRDVVKDHAGAAYMYRYYLRHRPSGDVRLHRIVASDDARYLHDHPWDFTSHLLTGTYLEHTAHGVTRYTAGDTIHRTATLAHRLELDAGDVWTYVTTGRIRRRWGFHTETGWVPWRSHLEGGGVSGAVGFGPE